jgi:hypothetical protein
VPLTKAVKENPKQFNVTKPELEKRVGFIASTRKEVSVGSRLTAEAQNSSRKSKKRDHPIKSTVPKLRVSEIC